MDRPQSKVPASPAGRQGPRSEVTDQTATTKKLVIEAKGLTKTYGDGKTRTSVLKGVDLEMAEGEFLTILGPSGSGKSTLMHILGAMDLPSSGQVHLFGQDLKNLSETERSHLRNKKIGFVFQFDSLLPEFTVEENVLMPARIAGEDRKPRALELLRFFGLSRVQHKFPPELSGGEKQRAALVRALLNHPELLLADEPTGNLDKHNTELVLHDLWELSQSKKVAIVLVTHNEQASRFSSRTLHMTDGKLTEAG
ncbi:MAG: ABC transporter ATP-binding protein [Elusimicrobia bacterium]|nr:ABC transporter ATP-binding protein [Elusimicrobiota bacterium]